MLACVRNSSRPIRIALAALFLGAAGGMAAGATPAPQKPAPRRVVSMNLCTDQLAMLLAAKGQLISVSDLASDPYSSAMVKQARAYPANYGQAESIYLMHPDLVVTGRYTSRASVDMLKRLGMRVVIFNPAYSLADVRARILKMGRVLGRKAAAAKLVANFDTRLATLRKTVRTRPRAALYYANGYTSGDKTLAGQILDAAGFTNVATKAGYLGGGVMPLEVLVMAAPDIVFTSKPYPGGSRAEAILHHPALTSLRHWRAGAGAIDQDWICGTPYVLRAIKALGKTRANLARAK